MESRLCDCLYRAQWNYLHIENQATGKIIPCNVKDGVHVLPVSCGMLTKHLAGLENL